METSFWVLLALLLPLLLALGLVARRLDELEDQRARVRMAYLERILFEGKEILRERGPRGRNISE